MKTPKIIASEYTKDGASYRIKWPCGMTLWFDLWRDEDGQLTGDWNKYIFHTNDEEDMKEKAFQEANNDDAGAYNYSDALDIATMQYLKDKKN